MDILPVPPILDHRKAICVATHTNPTLAKTYLVNLATMFSKQCRLLVTGPQSNAILNDLPEAVRNQVYKGGPPNGSILAIADTVTDSFDIEVLMGEAKDVSFYFDHLGRDFSYESVAQMIGTSQRVAVGPEYHLHGQVQIAHQVLQEDFLSGPLSLVRMPLPTDDFEWLNSLACLIQLCGYVEEINPLERTMSLRGQVKVEVVEELDEFEFIGSKATVFVPRPYRPDLVSFRRAGAEDREYISMATTPFRRQCIGLGVADMAFNISGGTAHRCSMAMSLHTKAICDAWKANLQIRGFSGCSTPRPFTTRFMRELVTPSDWGKVPEILREYELTSKQISPELTSPEIQSTPENVEVKLSSG